MKNSILLLFYYQKIFISIIFNLAAICHTFNWVCGPNDVISISLPKLIMADREKLLQGS